MTTLAANPIDWQAIDGYRFQELCMDLLAVEGFGVQPQGVGPDGGVDAILFQTMKLPDNTCNQLRWAAQFKYRQNADATVKPSELGNIGNVLDRFQAGGFFLITNGRVTQKAYAELRATTDARNPPYLLSVWTRREIEDKMSTHLGVARRYFPAFVSTQPTITVVEIILDIPIEQFLVRQTALLQALASSLEILVSEINIKEILKGSTIVVIELPHASARQLLDAFDEDPAFLEDYGFQYRILEVRQSETFEEEADTSIRQEMEWLRSKILAIGPRELEELTAALFRAQGYFTWISPAGADRGVDVLATPDLLGLSDPPLKVQVKHRPNRRLPAPEIRELVGALGVGDQGLCISTGGFTRAARYEAKRAMMPIRLVDLDELILLILRHYDQLEPAWRAILPLQKVLWSVRTRRPNH